MFIRTQLAVVANYIRLINIKRRIRSHRFLCGEQRNVKRLRIASRVTFPSKSPQRRKAWRIMDMLNVNFDVRVNADAPGLETPQSVHNRAGEQQEEFSLKDGLISGGITPCRCRRRCKDDMVGWGIVSCKERKQASNGGRVKILNAAPTASFTGDRLVERTGSASRGTS